jgi:hypothetical protein
MRVLRRNGIGGGADGVRRNLGLALALLRVPRHGCCLWNRSGGPDASYRAELHPLGTPIWLGQPSSVCKRVLERMDAFLSETDDQGRMVSFGKVAAVAVVGNEDGAHHVCAELFQALNDVGFTLAAGAGTYWVGEAMQKKDYKDLAETPEQVAKTTATLARNAAHLAAFLRANNFPGGRQAGAVRPSSTPACRQAAPVLPGAPAKQPPGPAACHRD